MVILAANAFRGAPASWCNELTLSLSLLASFFAFLSQPKNFSYAPRAPDANTHQRYKQQLKVIKLDTIVVDLYEFQASKLLLCVNRTS